MAEEKMTIVDLRKAIAKQAGVSEAVVNTYLNSLFESIVEGLKKDKSVKVAGLGTFKLQWVEPRKSVNISTGENIVIEGYNKLSFSAESSVKARVNEPFSTLEAVELDNDGNPIPGTEKARFSQIDKFGEQAEEIRGLLDDLAAPIVEEKPDEPVAEAVVETVVETVAEAAVETVVETVAEPVVEPIATEVQEPAKEELEKEEPKKPYRPWLVMTITMLVWIVILVGLFFYLQHKAEDFINTANERLKTPKTEMVEPVAEESVQAEETITEEPITETPATEDVATETPISAAPVMTEPVKQVTEPVKQVTDDRLPASVVNFLTNERQYTDFQGVATVNEGSRLTWIAKKQYGRKDFWVFIYEANRDKIKNPSNVQVGTELRIPTLPKELMNANQEAVEAYTKALHDKYLGI